MAFSKLLSVLATAAILVNAAPTDPQVALARQYAPQWRFHKDEVYFPSSIEYFLAGPIQMDDNKGNSVFQQQLTTSNLNQGPNSGAGTFLTTDINAGKGGFLRGQNPATTSGVTVNTFIAPKDNGVVDLYYWLFTPFNQGKSIPILGEVGDHVGDWERITIRTVNGEATQIDYHAHDDKGSGTIPYAQAPKFDNGQRPVAYVAKGSHGFWNAPGTFTYVNAVVFQLQDITSDGGVAWDTRDSIVPLLYPDSAGYTGDKSWLNYQGAWGNQGVTNCWWHFIHPECEVEDGPGGPLRADVLGAQLTANIKTTDRTKAPASPFTQSMSGHLSHVLGTASTESASEITLRINPSVRDAVAGSEFIAVQQTCAERKGEKEEDVELTTTIATTALSSSNQFTVKPNACQSGNIAYYTIGLCSSSDASTCQFSSHSRNLRAFSADPSVHGIQNATAIKVDDLDNWEWS